MADLPELPDGVIYLEGKTSPMVLAGILGVNVSLIYQESQAGRLPRNFQEKTYRENLQSYISYYKKAQDVKLEKERERQREIKENGAYVAIHPTVEKKYLQDIRLNVVREAQGWQKLAIERKKYISLDEMQAICEPFVLTIREHLLTLSMFSIEAQKEVDNMMDILYSLGKALVNKAQEDDSLFVDTKLKEEIIFPETDER